jgi:glycosyltransferase involved in cell wall biosynthesis
MEIIQTEDQALLVEPGAPDQLASAITDLLDNPGRKESLGANARSRVVECFSFDRMTRATADLLDEIAGQATLHDV